MGRLIQLCLFITFQIFSASFFLDAKGSNPSDDHGRGLTIKLIHRDSPDSPLYQPNPHQNRKNQKPHSPVHSSVKPLGRSRGGMNNSSQNAVRSRVDQYYNSIFMAQVGIGTFSGLPPFRYFLHVDSGSSLTWIQCEACRAVGNHCFFQSIPVFPNSHSTTYRNLIYNRSPLCFPGQHSGNLCTYFMRRGSMASESFMFESTTGQYGMETISGMVFGCGESQENMLHFGDGKIAGLLGLGWGSRSLVNQLGDRARSKFSYCFQSKNSVPGMMTTLRFGSDIPTPAGLITTALVRVPHDEDTYFVNLIDISIGERRLGIPPEYFSRRGGDHSKSGVIIDSETSYTMVVLPVYSHLDQMVDSYLRVHVPGVRRISAEGLFKTCYQGPPGRGVYDGLPTVTFHFDGGADMVVQPQGVFYVGGPMRRPFFCLGMISSRYDSTNGGLTILGASQQTDHWVIYDLIRREIKFAPQDCSRSG